MSLEFTPIADQHAIEACAMVVRLFQPLDPESMDRLREELFAIPSAADLPSKHAMTGATFFFGPQGVAAPPPPVTGGWLFQRFAPDGKVQAELRCEAQAITLTVREYDRWADLMAFAERTLFPALQLYMQTFPVLAAVLLQYEDKFWAADNDVSTNALFRDDTQWVNISHKGSKDPWHSHFGMFVARDRPNNRELVNVNVNVLDMVIPSEQVERRAAAITVLVGDMYDIPQQEPLTFSSPEEGVEYARRSLSISHERQRKILNNVLQDDYLRAIGALD